MSILHVKDPISGLFGAERHNAVDKKRADPPYCNSEIVPKGHFHLFFLFFLYPNLHAPLTPCFSFYSILERSDLVKCKEVCLTPQQADVCTVLCPPLSVGPH